MPAVSGSPTQIATSEPNVAALESVETAQFQSGDLAYLEAIPVGGGRYYYLDKTSSAAPDGALVLYTRNSNPAYGGSGPGRWLFFLNPVPGGNGTLSVPNLAARPTPNTLPDDTLVFVRSQRSWYRSDLGGNVYFREPIADASWMAQVAWGVDSATGNDENVGSVASPLQTLGELITRLPSVNLTTTVTVAAGSAFAANDWLEWQPIGVPGAQATAPTITVNGVRTLGANNLVVASSDEAGNAPPLIDIGIALTPNVTILQATTGAQAGATTAVGGNTAGTTFRTAPWRDAAGNRVAPPAPGDQVAVVTNPSVGRVGWGSTTCLFRMTNMNIAAIDLAVGKAAIIFRTSQIAGSLLVAGALAYLIDGCAMNMTGGWQFRGAVVFTFFKCAIGGSASTALIEAGANLIMNDCVYQQTPTIIVRNNAFLDCNSLGIFGTLGSALTIVQGGQVRVRGTLYGTGNAGDGTRVLDNGHITVDAAATPTLAAAGQELQLEGQATASAPPPLGTGVIPIAVALTTWAQWVAAPFARQVMSYFSGSSISSA